MQIEVTESGAGDAGVFERLGQLYAYDFSEILGDDVDEAGQFRSVEPGDLIDPDITPFLVRVDGKLAGFALVHRGSRLSSDADVTDMDEFFIMRKFRRQGAGTAVARRLFDAFPGRWEVRELAQNVAAQAFWRRVIGEYTGGRYEERKVSDERRSRVVQSFVSGARRE